MRRLVVDRALDDGRRVLEEYETDRAADEPKDSPRARIAQNLKRQIDTVSERWSMLCRRSEDWQHWIDEVLRVSTFHGTGTNCVLFCSELCSLIKGGVCHLCHFS